MPARDLVAKHVRTLHLDKVEKAVSDSSEAVEHYFSLEATEPTASCMNEDTCSTPLSLTATTTANQLSTGTTSLIQNPPDFQQRLLVSQSRNSWAEQHQSPHDRENIQPTDEASSMMASRVPTLGLPSLAWPTRSDMDTAWAKTVFTPAPEPIMETSWFELQGIAYPSPDTLHQSFMSEVPNYGAERHRSIAATANAVQETSGSVVHRRLPHLLDEERPPTLLFKVDHLIHSWIRQDLFNRHIKLEAIQQMPSPWIYQSYLSSYAMCFHCHFPIIHLQSLGLDKTPSPLILAICCIGALYRLDRSRAGYLYDLAVRSTKTVRSAPVQKHP
ncbi:hypothetical protein AK830_g2765 [Neonectria ditissima]|uniref:Uncharacterized protein n=1 Tax=Neonectria ditissima TaxID=78410 RepID=A0A0P7BAH4_9HYPO|nr:hypothetical protein AK830_g2765 [Neonectria ditissima]